MPKTDDQDAEFNAAVVCGVGIGDLIGDDSFSAERLVLKFVLCENTKDEGFQLVHDWIVRRHDLGTLQVFKRLAKGGD
jgi:hypothetical protein